MSRLNVLLGPVLGLLIAAAGGCATTSDKLDPGEQEKLDLQYRQAVAEKAQLQKKKQAVHNEGELLFNRAGALEKKRKLSGSKSQAVHPKSLPLPGKGLVVGPLKFKNKTATFDLYEKPGKSTVMKMKIHDIKVIPE